MATAPTGKAMFIRVEIDEAVQSDPALCKRLVEVCPVDIFALEESGRVTTVEQNLDECTLCDLCIQASPEGQVRVVKLYREPAG
jgi:NAD-dependent dihydropyrimidine dehydrogenase PreA subunit